MTSDSNVSPPPAPSSSSGDKKLQMHVDNDYNDDKHLLKPRLLRLTSYLYPILLVSLLIIGTALLVITVTRRNTCRQLLDERIESSLGLSSKDHVDPWVACVKTSNSHHCVCPASFIRSTLNPSHCIPSHSRCLQSCKTNHHCSCHNLQDGLRCLEVTRNWVENELKISPIERLNKNLLTKNILQYPWTDHANRNLEHMLVNTHSGERLFFSSDRRTGITINEHDDDYLINERWTKFETNTTQHQIIYTQLDPQDHSCRMSLVDNDGSITHGSVHTCPSAYLGAPYFLGVACQNILVLWHGNKQANVQRQEGWAVSRHNFESDIPQLPILLDPFHRYYSLYDDLMMEIKDLNGDVLGQLFTNIYRPTKFEFIDQYGTILVANQTHMQLLSSTNKEAWLDF
ncbi:unnamed protein product [Adineta steineri]|uniref:Uncharacterized protein n=1 Tax=Adineta steineri TaxID=433720 RepID=A0A814JEU1_9BILA|nr:unnamed protein product [Adineta steineri]